MKFEGEARIERVKRPRIEGKAQTDGEGRGQSPSSEALTAGKGRIPSESATARVSRPSGSPGAPPGLKR